MADLTGLWQTLIGGGLTIAGGIIGNFYVQFSTRRTEKQKTIKSSVEKIYQETQQIEGMYSQLLSLLEDYNKPKTGPLYEDYDAYSAQSEDIQVETAINEGVNNIEERIKAIDLLIALYIPLLHQAFESYEINIIQLIKVINPEVAHMEKIPSKEVIRSISKNFQASLVKFIKKKGYS